MAYDVSALTAYVDQLRFPLLRRSILGAETVSIIEKAGGVQTGVKSTATINVLDFNIVLQNQGGAFTPTGSIKVTQRQLATGKVKVQVDMQPEVLDAYFTQYELQKGSIAENETMPFEEVFTSLLIDQVNAVTEQAVWRGSLQSSTFNWSFYDGLAKQIINGTGSFGSGSNQVLSGAAGNLTFSGSTAISVVDTIYANIPEQVLGKPDITIFMGYDFYRNWTTAIKNANLYHYQVGQESNFETILPGTSVKVKAVHGLDGSNFIVALRESNMKFGTDLTEDFEHLDIWYSKDFHAVRCNLQYKAAANVAFPEETVYFQVSGSLPY